MYHCIPQSSHPIRDTRWDHDFHRQQAGIRLAGLSALIILLDWWTKQWASRELTMFERVEVFSWFNLTLVHNFGAAFSFLSDAGGWQRWFLTLLAVVVTVILLVWLLRLDKGEWLKGLSLGLLIGGAIGNLADRIRLGYVVDFIDWHYGGWHWPAFNIADAAITCGIILLLLDAFFEAKREKQAKAAEEH